MNSQSILLIDDDANFCTSVQLALEDRGHRPQIADNAHKGIEMFAVHLDSETPFDLILTDMRMPLRTGQPEDEPSMYVCLGLVFIDLHKHQLSVACAGLWPPVVWQNGQPLSLKLILTQIF
jgi:CheY-like chemotaxis protein